MSYLFKHKPSCKKTVVGPPYTCKYCKKSFSHKKTLGQHVRNCAEKERTTLRNCGAPASKEISSYGEPNNVAAEADKEDDDHHAGVEVHEDPDETRDDHISCKQCVKVFTQEDFRGHQEQTGHDGDIIKLPKGLCV